MGFTNDFSGDFLNGNSHGNNTLMEILRGNNTIVLRNLTRVERERKGFHK